MRVPILTRRRAGPVRHVAAAVVFAALVVWLVSFRPPAADAHETTLALAVPETTGRSEFDAAEIRDGLRLAVELSPDVGHAPGPAAGDHLGGVDVTLIDIDSRLSGPIDAAFDRAIADGASIVLVVGDPATVTAAARALSPHPVLLVAVIDGSETPAERPERMAVLRPDRSARLAQNVARFDAAFKSTYDRAPSISAAVGYDLGQVLDIAIAEAGGALPDVADLQKVRAEVDARLVQTNYEVVDRTSIESDPEADSPASDDPTPDGEEPGWGSSLWLGALAGGLVFIFTVDRLVNRQRDQAEEVPH